MWPYPWTHVGTPSHLGHMDRVAATMPSQAHAGAAQEAPDIGQWEGQDVPLVRPSSCNVKGGIPSSRRYLPTYLSLAWHTRPHKIRSQTHELTSEACHVHNRRGFGANDGIFLGMDLWSISPLYTTFWFHTCMEPLNICRMHF